jgi:hypothetical protein
MRVRSPENVLKAGPVERVAESPSAAPIAPVLTRLGFRFDPFLYDEASRDPHLGKYIVGHDIFAAVAWNDAPAFIFAPAGGGKTTMRIYTARSCWVALGGSHPFPIVFLPSNQHGWPTPESVLQQLVEEGAVALLIGLAFRPERLLALPSIQRQAVASLLAASLPGDLDYYLDVLQQEGSPAALSAQLDRPYILPDPPDASRLDQLCEGLRVYSPSRSDWPTPEDQFNALVACLQDTLHFGSVLILIDGVDALPETSTDPASVIEWLRPLLARGPAWAQRRIYLKGFLSEEAQIPLMNHLGHTWPLVRSARLEWTPDLLADLIHRRVYRATEGKFGSLDAFSSSELRDVETMLVRLAPPLPRELIVLVHRVLHEFVLRVDAQGDNKSDQLQQADLDAAVAWYRSQPVHPLNLLAN